MDHMNNTHLRLVADNETSPELASVVAAIRPLPRDIEPSPKFMGELRLRLLDLEPRHRTNREGSQRAA